ncbi:PREDICTED: uncharacterized protein LOC108444909 [Corvus brachyrhynchos]|uniref:uncharacterized protein LOC108444909 n=1 Tax=Corvus brachyrhynchos TaxID=85066 RepID=UPI00081654D8|nr:PREDICTED: uncharacterized protein LOC108444909 [Corvus brachyrhynchos]XP_017582618.1 PREDICTED: uncharacterized protein LOC108444909 [Corvus brachyrhynchos]XP_017582619.1 PREDICTED: uncharacterized protein LOC108444909 [Corvus brachyrhynchos]XP_017582620.1 PREDICTED: uncharacterized protein LOC108444909 [Corvus brachyrhynchos]XP_017582621.1 PREDICTED: uncharacterized protein LOC108444909 [Corvus brachyrhynchos]XP_017582622.1 PREDICTED: uncharacterized protein LOC108444909 [Corvus brachyrhy
MSQFGALDPGSGKLFQEVLASGDFPGTSQVSQFGAPDPSSGELFQGILGTSKNIPNVPVWGSGSEGNFAKGCQGFPRNIPMVPVWGSGSEGFLPRGSGDSSGASQPSQFGAPDPSSGKLFQGLLGDFQEHPKSPGLGLQIRAQGSFSKGSWGLPRTSQMSQFGALDPGSGKLFQGILGTSKNIPNVPVWGSRSELRGAFPRDSGSQELPGSIPIVLIWGSRSKVREAFPRAPGDSQEHPEYSHLGLWIQAQGRSGKLFQGLLGTSKNIPNLLVWGSRSELRGAFPRAPRDHPKCPSLELWI